MAAPFFCSRAPCRTKVAARHPLISSPTKPARRFPCIEERESNGVLKCLLSDGFSPLQFPDNESSRVTCGSENSDLLLRHCKRHLLYSALAIERCANIALRFSPELKHLPAARETILT